MRTRENLVTEREGMNYVRQVVEGAGSFFKEINLQHDVGHDATIVPVIGGQVQPREIAVQVKSGASYASAEECHIPAKWDHICFWADHDLQTLGIVFDPAESCAFWVDLTVAAGRHRRDPAKSGHLIRFRKSAWNRLDRQNYEQILVPTLMGKAPDCSVEVLCDWARSEDLETHDIGVRALRARHHDKAETWACMIDLLDTAQPSALSPEVGISLAKLVGHDDMGFYSGEIPDAVRRPAVARVRGLGGTELARLLAMVEDGDFERPSFGYSLMPLWAWRPDSADVLAQIAADPNGAADVRHMAGALATWQRSAPDDWTYWRRNR